MTIKNFDTVKNIHCIGIGGSGLSGLARLLKQKGKNVSGSDDTDSLTMTALQQEGLTIFKTHKAENVPEQTEIIIYSLAIPEDNPERILANQKNIILLSYPEAVGILTQQKKTICICGTHGKTTTTGLVTAGLMAAGKNPTVIIGSPIAELDNQNQRLGRDEFFILEACEYQRAFLHYQPHTIILTNIEADHLDYFKDLEDYKDAFRQFIAKLPLDGLLIANADDENVRSICENFKGAPIKWFGVEDGVDYQLKQNSIYKKDRKILDFQLQIPGFHNQLNALAAVTLASILKLDLFDVREGIQNFKGASRRFEEKGQIGKTTIIDDYAHHPTEILATLKAAREKFGDNKKILCVFQPHQYSRTHKLLEGFAKSFADADEVIIPNIYKVRDSAEDQKNVNEEMLVKKITENGKKARVGNGLDKTIELIKAESKNFDVMIIMGAGDVWKITEGLLK